MCVVLSLVACGGSGKAASQHTVGVSVSGLAGSGLVLELNGSSALPITASGIATFATPLMSGTTYAVSVGTQPSSPAQTCSVSNGMGTIGTSNVTGITVVCTVATFTVSASVSGLSGSGLALQLNGGTPLSITSNGSITFPLAIKSGATYTVDVISQPAAPTQVCAVSNGSGTVGAANVTDIDVTCVTSSAGLPTPPATMLYFANGTEYGSLGGGQEGWLANLIAYPANSSGSVSATAVIASSNLTDRYFCVATDASGYIYVATHAAFGAYSQGKVLVYAPTASGMTAPVRTITITGAPVGLVLDAGGNLYVGSTGVSMNPEAPVDSIVEFAAGATGDATPVRTIALAAPCTNLATDAGENLICLPFDAGNGGPSNEIQIFASNQSGAVAPARTIQLDNGVQIVDVAVDPFGNLYVAVGGNGEQILEIPGGAGGTGVASAVPGIPAGTLRNFVTNIRFDAAGNLYVFGPGPSGDQSVLRFAPTTSGFAPPASEDLVSPTFPFGFAQPIVAGFAIH